ncbi:MAG: hypothetical protein JNL67_05315 [Planctomycetaceae bacterium]|nr:hypothetical protein [Planctomycetaceae bacterium]
MQYFQETPCFSTLGFSSLGFSTLGFSTLGFSTLGFSNDNRACPIGIRRILTN